MSPPLWILCFTSFNHLALVFNASVNFLIYFSCGSAFKQTLLKFVRVLPLQRSSMVLMEDLRSNI